MNLQSLLAVALATFVLTGCAGGGPMLAEPAVSQSNMSQARRDLSTHRLERSRDLPYAEMQVTLNRVWGSLESPLVRTCSWLFIASGCWNSINSMRIIVVNRNDINAYADASNFTIGVHAGFLRSAGDDDEVAAVLAHEAAHLLFGHAQKKASNAATGALLGGIAMGALGAAMHQPGMDTEYIGDMMEGGFNTGWNVGYLAYSPEMELEADQFAMYVLKQANRRLTAGTDLIVRLHRGDVPAPVRRGDGWASYLATHPANDYRLAAMRSTLDGIRAGATRPVSMHELEQFELAMTDRLHGGYVPTVISRSGSCAWVQEYDSCEWWDDEPGRFLWPFRCPSPHPISGVGASAWRACLR